MPKLQIVNSFRYALRGLGHVFTYELSFRLQLLASAAVVFLMLWFPLVLWQRVMLLVLIVSVLVLEVINTVFERLIDAFKPRLHPVVAEIKDMMAAAVLLASVVAAVIGLLIFWPYWF
ncbi:MAG: diacylglycerol kinase [Patescibacteria group bacterium]